MRVAAIALFLLLAGGSLAAQVNASSASTNLSLPTAMARGHEASKASDVVHPITLSQSYEHYVHEIPLAPDKDQYLKPVYSACQEHLAVKNAVATPWLPRK
ncbi:hypothetical protein [Tunturibacter empetritectus]|uniref:Uncharacterized protein n=1 Tax=Tunturiibacter lichenicola TaxID=2051959 RepID=A0A7W8J9E9_9BACT|nr:hypothetical protein [Edaphobacter lichenicola]MBB5344906.1 hypothetical protein [Edaphobacter lichenicola]